MLTRAVYVSSAYEGIDKTTVENILETARTRNAQMGITGILICAGNQFIQLIEGEEKEIEGLLKLIQRDRRHHDMELLVKEAADSRVFSQWAMAYSVIDADDLEQIGGTFDMKVASEFLAYLGGSDSYLKPFFKEIFDQIK